jgi:hypothetical protein
LRRGGAIATGALLLLAALPVDAAQATVRNAVAQGGATTGECTVVACTLPQALNAAVDGDEVLVHPGEYAVAPFTIDDRVYVHGVEGRPRPRIIDSAGGVQYFVQLADVDIRLRHLHIETELSGSTLHSTFPVTLEQLVVVAGSGSGAPMLLELAGPVIRNTIVRSEHMNGVALTLRATTDAQLRNVTAHAPGSGGIAVIVEAGDYQTNPLTPCEPSVPGSATARNVIARGGRYDIRVYSQCGKAASVNIRNSNFRPDHVNLDGPMASLDDGGAAGGNQSGNPLFANAPNGNLHLLAGSPAIDRGMADPQNGTADIDGDPRTLGAAIDIGADEFVPEPASTSTSPPSNEFTLGKAKKNKKKGTAKLPATVPGPGSLKLLGKGLKEADEDAASAGEVKLRVKSKGGKKHKLSEKGRVKVNPVVTYIPTGGTPNTESKKVKLVKR